MTVGVQQSRLLRIITLLYRRTAEDIESTYQDLLEQRKQAWRSTIQQEARKLGYMVAAEGPRRQDLEYIKSLCRQDAQSIVNTWNRDVERRLLRLYQANPRGNRFYYIHNMEAWATKRSRWKDREIAVQTEYTIVGYAKQRFWAENGMRGGKHRFVGPPPACGRCLTHFSKGEVNQAYVDANPTPIHIGCDHTWEIVRGTYPRPGLDELWVG